MLGKLTWQAIPFDQPIIMGTVAVVGVVGLAILGLMTVKGWWPYLWREWITSVDHKRIGVNRRQFLTPPAPIVSTV
jgi:cytochrome o ubiquinol oxidase subunit 1